MYEETKRAMRILLDLRYSVAFHRFSTYPKSDSESLKVQVKYTSWNEAEST